MVKILVVYDSGTGNTEKMAFAVAEGAKQVNEVEVVVKRVDQTSIDDLLNAEGIIMGSPTYYGQMTAKLKALVDESVEKSTLSSELTTINAYTDTLDILTDGGDTELLNSDITFSMPDEAMELRQQLLDASPYLSDTAMKNAINKENVLPNIMIRDILVANPQSSKTPDVINEIDNRIITMPDYLMAEIMNGQSITGTAEILEQQLVFHKKIYDKSLRKLEKYYLTDTANLSSGYDSLLYSCTNPIASEPTPHPKQ